MRAQFRTAAARLRHLLLPLALLAAAPAAATPLERADLEPWMDGIVANALARGDVAGGVVVVVRDGQVLFQKGYGFADVDKRVPVDPARTLFRLGSVSKLFTWTAVMQLVERDQLQLDRDINEYLDFRIPPVSGKPVTLRQLMTHTAGFEETIKRLLVEDPAVFPSLEQYVKETLPGRIFPPGDIPAYSNYGAALAGYIVQRRSGMSFDDYADRYILQPLRMQMSSFRQPLPAHLAPLLSNGYRVASGPPQTFEFCGPAPAGALSATGADAALFMLAHLQAERGADTPLLRAATARGMHAGVQAALPALHGSSLGFDQIDRNGHRMIGHSGDTQVFHSNMDLYLDDGVGIFTSFNSSGRDGFTYTLRTELSERFADRYFPAAPAAPAPTMATAAEHARLLADAGPYRSTRRAESSFVSLLQLPQQPAITVNADGTLQLSSATGANGLPKTWREVEPFVWQELDGPARLSARVVDGAVLAVGVEPLAQTELLQPVPRSMVAGWNIPLLLAAMATLLVTSLRPAWSATVTRSFAARRATGWPQRAAWAAAVLLLATLLGWATLLQAGMARFAVFDAALDPWIRLLQIAGLLGIAGTAAAIWNAWRVCRGDASRWDKASSVLTALACLAIVRFTIVFGLLHAPASY